MTRFLNQSLRLHLVRVLDALERHGSLLKASVAMGVSQPALTKSLKDLERITGAVLFDRHARGLTPTAPGLVMIRTARRILAELERIEEDLDQIAERSGAVVSVGALPVTLAGIMPRLLARLADRAPEITIRTEQGQTEDLLALLAARQIDLVIGRLYAPAQQDSFVRRELWTEPFALVARQDHPIFAAPERRLEAEIGASDILLPDVSQRIRDELDLVLDRFQGLIRPPLRSASISFIRERLALSDAVAIMPPMMVIGDFDRGLLRARALPVDAPPRPAGTILLAAQTPTVATEVFIQNLVAFIAELAINPA
jgi:LysR family pca operon transcriptional activator